MKTLLYLFAKVPRPGEVKTRLCPPLTPERATALHQAFVEDTLQLARRSTADAIHLATTDVGHPWLCDLVSRFGIPLVAQVGSDLGARMQFAIESALAQGYRGAAIIGSDSPSVPLRLLDRALGRMCDAPVVLAPAMDGGYWFVGATRVVPEMFSNIPWGTSQVFSQTIARLHQSRVPFARSLPWYDIDSPADLQRLRRHLARTPATRAVLGSYGAIAATSHA